jgi:hypothetical protein
MAWEVAYYAAGDDDRQPAEVFEDRLMRHSPKLSGKLIGVTRIVAATLPEPIGGGLLEKCRDFPGLSEIRTIFGNELARFVAGLDGTAEPSRLVPLDGFWKQPGHQTPAAALDRAAGYWRDYRATRKISPEEPGDVAL